MLFLVTLSLVVFGVVMVFSSSAVTAKEKFGDPNYFSFATIADELKTIATPNPTSTSVTKKRTLSGLSFFAIPFTLASMSTG